MTHHKKTHKKKRRATMNAFQVVVTWRSGLPGGLLSQYTDVIALNASASGGVIDITTTSTTYQIPMADIISATIQINIVESATLTEQAVTNLESYDAA